MLRKLFGAPSARPSRPSPRRRSRFRPSVEALADRILPAITMRTFTLATGTLTIRADAADDTILLTQDPSGTVFINGSPFNLPNAPLNVSDINHIDIRSGGGHDTIDLTGLTGYTGTSNLQGEAGNDTLLGSNSNDILLGMGGNDFLDGRGGFDVAEGWGGNDTILGGAGDDILAGGEDNDSVDGGYGNDLLDDTVDLPFETGTTNDTLMAGDGNDTLEGGNGTDRLVLSGRSMYGTTYTITGATAGTISLRTSPLITPATVVTYTGIERIDDLNPGSSGGPFGFANNLTYHATGGNDTLNVINGPSVDGVQTMQINRGAGTTALNFANKFAVTVNAGGGRDTIAIGGPLFGFIPAAGMASLTVNAGDHNDTVNVRASAANVGLTVNAGAGDDLVTVGSISGTLDDLRGAVTINGEGQTATGPGDRLIVNDAGGFPLARTYNLSASSVSRSGTGASNYTGMESLELRAGSGVDTINVSGTAAGTPVTLDTGAGADTVNVGTMSSSLSNLLGNLTVTGPSAQLDILVVSDVALDNPAGTGRPYTLRGNTLYVGQAASDTLVTFSNVGTLRLDGSRYSDRYTLRSLPAGVTSFEVHGNDGVDTLQGTDAGSTFVVTAADEGMLDGLVRFYSVGNLVGYHNADTFRFLNGASVIGVVNGGAMAVNTLDYSQRSDNLVVNLTAGTATAAMNGVVNIQNVLGGTGHDVLVGNAQANRLEGRGGRDVLIGGDGLDVLLGGDGEDILIGGTTAFDSDPMALAAIRAEWTSSRSYATRIDNLRGVANVGPRLNGNYILTTGPTGTVQDDGDGDTLTGAAATDWFFARLLPALPADVIDAVAGERVDLL
jgi:Ca2+-binding RTX toxin-like protein